MRAERVDCERGRAFPPPTPGNAEGAQKDGAGELAMEGDADADEDARERRPSSFWAMTIPTEVSPLWRGMNHAHPDSSVG